MAMANHPHSKAHSRSASVRVLVADDSPDFRAAARRLIAATEGFVVDGVAPCGEDAVELARQHKPDLALIDLNMPGIGGQEAAARIAVVSPETSVILMTSAPDRHTLSAALFDKRRLSPTTLSYLRTLAETWRLTHAGG
jgi:DNA-binding NarL/FixJ family response regulator